MDDFIEEFFDKVDKHNALPYYKIDKKIIDNNIAFYKYPTYLYFEKGSVYLLEGSFKTIAELKSKAFVFSINQARKIIEFYETFTEENLKDKLLKLGMEEDLISKCIANSLRIEAFARTFREMATEYIFEHESYSIIK